MFPYSAALGNYPLRGAYPLNTLASSMANEARPSPVATSMFPLPSTRPSGSSALFASSDRIPTPSSPGTIFHAHLFTIDLFDPEQSYATVIVVVPDAGELYEAFASGPAGRLRQAAVGRHPAHPALAQESGHGQGLQCRRPGRQLATHLQTRRYRGRRSRGPNLRLGPSDRQQRSPGRRPR